MGSCAVHRIGDRFLLLIDIRPTVQNQSSVTHSELIVILYGTVCVVSGLWYAIHVRVHNCHARHYVRQRNREGPHVLFDDAQCISITAKLLTYS